MQRILIASPRVHRTDDDAVMEFAKITKTHICEEAEEEAPLGDPTDPPT